MAARGLADGKYQGSKWLSRQKRLALYIRDNLACVYCGAGIEDGTQLTLDHLVPYSQGGTNDASNIVSCCGKCNSSRGDRSWKVFAKSVALYINHDVTVQQIISRIERTRHAAYDTKAALTMIMARGGYASTLNSLKKE